MDTLYILSHLQIVTTLETLSNILLSMLLDTNMLYPTADMNQIKPAFMTSNDLVHKGFSNILIFQNINVMMVFLMFIRHSAHSLVSLRRLVYYSP